MLHGKMKGGQSLIWICFFLLGTGCAATDPPEANEGAAADFGSWESLTMEEGAGTLFIIGGGSRPLSLMQGVVDRMASKDDLVIVLPMASSEPDTSAYYGIRPMRELGCTNVHALNLQPGTYGEAELDSVRNARAMYLCGGDQARFMQAVGGTEGPVAEAIREAYRRGAIISGSSAGAAMMSRAMITGDQKMEPEYERTYARLRPTAADSSASAISAWTSSPQATGWLPDRTV
jgi:cyanophycinase-like exopeptidase